MRGESALKRQRSTCAVRATPVVLEQAEEARPDSVPAPLQQPLESTTVSARSGLCLCELSRSAEGAGGERCLKWASSRRARGCRRRKAGEAEEEERFGRSVRDSTPGVGGESSARAAQSEWRMSGWGDHSLLLHAGSRRRRKSGEERKWGS